MTVHAVVLACIGESLSVTINGRSTWVRPKSTGTIAAASNRVSKLAGLPLPARAPRVPPRFPVACAGGILRARQHGLGNESRMKARLIQLYKEQHNARAAHNCVKPSFIRNPCGHRLDLAQVPQPRARDQCRPLRQHPERRQLLAFWWCALSSQPALQSEDPSGPPPAVHRAELLWAVFNCMQQGAQHALHSGS